MPLLTILDLSYTSVRELPDSLFELEQLREMYLKGCECFMKLSPKIGKLKKLEKLDLDGTEIIHLPEEIQELTKLQSLFLCFCEYRGKKGKQYSCPTIIPSEVISKLKGLKHLGIDVNPDDERWYENVLDILPEILGLEHLLTLNLYIPHLELLKFIPDRILLRGDFRFIVGRHMQRIISSTPSTCEAKFKQSGCSLKFVNGDDVPNEIERLVRHSKALFLERHKTINSLSGFNVMNLEQLRVCMLAECREMQTVVDGRKTIRGNDIFSHLLYLCISHMKSLRSIWEGLLPPRCFFGMLKCLVLQNCPELTTIFTLDFLGNLSLLKEIIVKDCPKVTTLISDGSFKHKGEVFLPNLRRILLLHLPELITISNGCYIAPSLNTMGIYDCPKLQSLSKSELSSQTLNIKGEIKWWDQLQWSREECGIPQRPSKFDGIFSSIDNQVDIMTQMGNDGDDIDDNADMMSLQTLFEHPEQNAETFSRISDDIDDDADMMSLQTLFEHPEQNAETSSRVSGDIDDDADMMSLQTLFEHPKQDAGRFSRVSGDIDDDADMMSLQTLFEHPKQDAGRFSRMTFSVSRKIPEPEDHTPDDGYSWRKYGQKIVAGSKIPSSYYKCTHVGCPVKKKLTRRSEEDLTIVEIVYKGTHTHPSRQRDRSLHELKSNVFDDDYRWKKYGEEIISGSPNPRSYYGCVSTDCSAKKHVQVSDEDPTMVEITSTGVHTCSTPFCEDAAVNEPCDSVLTQT
ncbi:disease resistance protein At4g27190-like isoform X2 [Neltuma alba]|uniref:disease resistance protein At4g27190-like isoform X2 n=1 Tax=Neltuma alba TaxID=207710 RepID=UPI0010A4A542|nr:disease resistance protein At4g27190-like isoform X2 [Prosopis alba]